MLTMTKTLRVSQLHWIIPEMLTMKWDHGHNNSIVNGIPRIGYMKGGNAAKWNDEKMADVFLNEAQQYVRKIKKSHFFYIMHCSNRTFREHPALALPALRD